MARFTIESAERVDVVLGAWAKMRPDKSFFGLTLEDFRKILKPFMDARVEVADLEVQMAHATSKRETAHNDAVEVIRGVVNAVKGDPTEGENGELYSAMGYVPWNQRSTGLKRPRKELPPSQQVHVPGAATAASPAKEGAQ